MSPDIIKSQLSLTLLSAGDLIDRAVRFCRRNFWTFILAAAPLDKARFDLAAKASRPVSTFDLQKLIKKENP